MAGDQNNKWDLKQLGVGGGSALGLLFLFQSQGIDLMNQKTDAQNNVILEKTLANAGRIDKLERAVSDFNDKLQREFQSLRDLMREDGIRITAIVAEAAKDRYTKSEHNVYAQSLDLKFQRLEDKIENCEKKSGPEKSR